MLKPLVRTALYFSLVLLAPRTLAQSVPPGFVDQSMITNLSNPVGCTWDANGRMYIWQKGGQVRIYENGTLLPTLFMDISDEVANWRDHGLLGFALDPNFLANGHVYALYGVDRHHLIPNGPYNPNTNVYFEATIMRITRFTAIQPGLNTVDPNSRLVLFGESPSTGAPMLHESHSTGQLVFGTDGTLMASLGDGASYNSVDVGSDNGTYYAQALMDGIIRPEENVGALRAQMVNSFSGKVIRIDPATGDGVPSNPFYDGDDPRSARSRVWALGLRNPYRMSLRPGSGSTNPADGDPGTLYIGDVGWTAWEELNICTEGGMNFGWPLYEGMAAHNGYQNALTANLDAPNPLYNGTTCTKQYFDFQDLLIQETLVHPAPFPNPCDPTVTIPAITPRFMHARPSIDWLHGNRSRCGAFNGTTAVTYDLDDPNSPVPGPRFGGNAALGGSWFQGSNYPQGYQNVYFVADYVGGWIRKVEVDANDAPISVANFGSALAALTWVGEGHDGALWYIAYNQSAVRRIVYGGSVNLQPVAVAQQDVQYGPGPLTVNFTGSNSTDPENTTLTHAWNFGDGQTSNAADPVHVFTAPPGVPTSYIVTLTVTDAGGLTDTEQLLVSVNNSPPQVTIDSPVDGTFYPVGVTTNYPLSATVTDAEHPPAQLSYAWRTILHHNQHQHPEPVDNDPVSSALVTGEGCNGEDFYHRFILSVTDAHGLVGGDTAVIHPDCSAIAPLAIMNASVTSGLAPLAVNFSATQSFDPGTIVSYAWDFGDGTTGSGATVSHMYTADGDHVVTLTCTDDDGLTGTATGLISVYSLGAAQCVGTPGTIFRQYWNNISGTSVTNLTSSPNYPNNPTGSGQRSTFSGPVNFGDNYGTRLRGYVIPSQSGSYRFTITSDDNSQFFLSVNQEPERKLLRAYVNGWTNTAEFTKFASQRSAWIQLEAGQYYYAEMLQKEGTGGDHLQVYWEGPGISSPTLIGSANLAPWVDCPPSVDVRMILQGAHDAQAGMMRDDLRSGGHLPLTEPYTATGYVHAGGGGGETTTSQMLSMTGVNAIVDWVVIELRNKLDPSVVVATKSALLQRDGDVIGVDGNRRLLLAVPENDYFVAVRHRNHLGVMLAGFIHLDKERHTVDLTLSSTAAHGTDARAALSNGKMALWMGDVVRDGVVRYTGGGNDRDPILSAVGGVTPTNSVTGYSPADVNMDGVVRYTGTNNDRDPILFNVGGTVPSNVRQGQLP